jgi:hypothetical protein
MSFCVASRRDTFNGLGLDQARGCNNLLYTVALETRSWRAISSKAKLLPFSFNRTTSFESQTTRR